MGWTNPLAHLFSSGEVLTAANLDTYVTYNLAFLGAGYGAIIYLAGSQSVNSTVSTPAAFDTVENDPNGMATTGASAKITVPTGAAGVYTIAAVGGFVSPGFDFLVGIGKNGSTSLAQADWPSAGGSGAATKSVATQAFLNAGDYIQLNLFQTSGSAVAVANGRNQCNLCMHLLGPQ